MRDELHELTADVLSALQDLQARGLRSDVPDEQDPSAPESAWAELASKARDTVAAGAGGMKAVRDELGACTRCPLGRTRRNLVFGVGDPTADLVIIGEGPGAEEDAQGEPFVGPAGQMLDKMLQHVLGLRREQVYILNVVKCRPPRNRNPEPEEIATCMPFLHGQLRALQPRVGLVLGSVAYKSLFQTNQGITRARGRFIDWRDEGSPLSFPVMPTFHPAYLLRKPEDKRHTFNDLKLLRARYDDEGGRR